MWKSLVQVVERGEGKWFWDKLEMNIGNGAASSFWDALWGDERPLKDKLPRLFRLSLNKEGTLADMGC